MFNVKRPPMYDEAAVQPMRDELLGVGFEELRTPEAVDAALNVNDDKTVLVVINSVCGCAAGSARPGVSLALQNDIIPDRITTVFAGQDRDAVDQVRNYIKDFPPSSPSMGLFKNGELLYFMPRFDIEGRSADQIAAQLVKVFNKACSKKGPSVPAEHFDSVKRARMCGSKIPLYQG